MNNVPNILMTHTYGSGGTSVVEELEKKIPYEKRIVTQDAARFFLRKKGLDANNTTIQQKVELETFVIASSIGAIMQATHTRVMALMDNSLIEALAYCEGLPMPEALIDKVYEHLMDYRNHSVAYVIPPTIPLENDGLRHSDKEFRIEIHQRIMQIIEAFNIPHHLLSFQTVAYRADEVLHTHKNLYSFK